MGREEHSPLTRESQTMPTNWVRPPTLLPPSYLPAGVFTISFCQIGGLIEHDEVDKVVDLLFQELAEAQPLGLLGLG